VAQHARPWAPLPRRTRGWTATCLMGQDELLVSVQIKGAARAARFEPPSGKTAAACGSESRNSHL
jgi:hypothetical protein